ncbi:MAG: hypothetical protein RL481_1380 [Pseudomonadota bacterium]|jgi:hypothetical protein
MDKIQKLVFGCLALVGLIVMAIPSGDPLAKPGQEQAGAPANPAVPVNAPTDAPIVVPPPPALPANPAEGNGNNNANADGFAVQDFDMQNFGQPMFDPTPPGERKRLSEAAANAATIPQQIPNQPIADGDTVPANTDQ